MMNFSNAGVPLSPSTISSHLLGQIQRWDAHGWQRMVRVYGPLVYHWGRRAGLQAHDAADLVQDVFRKVLQNVDAFRRDRAGDSFRGWLWTIAHNTIRDQFRQQEAAPQPTGGSQAHLLWEQFAFSPSASSDEPSEKAALLRRALIVLEAEFEPRTWQAFWRTAVSGHPATEVAADLGMSPGSVRQAKYRVLLRLRRELEPLD